ncbi:respiratory burst oxidase homolog protein E-like isoform X1 [Oryza glaberrima]|uniref:respiratory burst oxidase homolog protein E-like isoform X1 n=1 Tax=Oryza glaberrima TaxID=4538 RepID=UPI00224C46C1|nr:respiratory burst oxidase homolog protein E-like isoform X1 [Oryza glaberrima]
MWTPSRGSASGRRATGHRRIADYLADDRTEASTENGSFNTAYSDELFAPTSSSAGGDGVGGMLPAFLADQSDLVEVMLELDEESMVVRSVTPTTGALYGPTSLAGGGAAHTPPGSGRSLSRCSSTSSRIRKKFAWLRSPSPAPAPRAPTPSEPPPPREAAMAGRERRRIQARLNRSRSGARRALKGLRFISRTTGSAEAAELWTRVEHRFNALSRDGLLSRDDFGDCIGKQAKPSSMSMARRARARSRDDTAYGAGIGAGMEDSKEFAVGIFDALARRRRQELERISKEELYDFWVQISDQSFDARLQIFFDMVDTNVDGRITREEVQELIVLSASANKLSKLKEQAEEYASLIMEELDPEDLGYIELWQLEALLLQRDAYMNYSRPLSSGSTAQWSQNLGGGGGGGGGQQGGQGQGQGQSEGRRNDWRRRWSPRRAAARAQVAAEENWRRAWVLALWFAAMAGLFAWKFVQYRRTPAFRVMGYCLPTAKGAAETLKLNMALVLLPVCRNTLTWLRSSWARFFVPFDDSITFHKIIATAIALGICTHAGTHLACDFPRLIGSSREEYELLLSGFFGASRPTYRGLLAGVEGVTGIVMVVLMVVSFTLATRPLRKREAPRLPFPLGHLAGFNAFWYSHHLLIVVYLLLLVHGWFMFLVTKWHQRTTWMYIAVPLMLYVGERTLRAFRSKAYAVKILKVCLLPGNVLTITMSKPYGFRYRSGQYIFLQCPTISPFEWHPFSITSAPGDDYISVHIQTRGDWTQELKRIFVENYFVPSVPRRASFGALGMAEQKSPPRLLVDGPYGAPAQDFRNYDVLLLVGLGIGATPFISILRDLLNNIKLADELMDLAMETSRSDDSANSFSVSTASSNKRRAYRTSRAHFYWVTREPGSFEWFKGVMNEVAEMDKKGVIELHNYLTSVYEERDARSTLLSMVQALNHAKHGVDIVSGTRVRTHFARPNWKEVFTRIASKHPNSTVGVFYCGKPTLAKELKKLSLDMSHKTTTRFHFHKEYF